jgi:hypothetical protein
MLAGPSSIAGSQRGPAAIMAIMTIMAIPPAPIGAQRGVICSRHGHRRHRDPRKGSIQATRPDLGLADDRAADLAP